MKTEIFEKTLPTDAMAVREEVFVLEQGFCDEFDENDTSATHFVVYGDDAVPIATCRVFPAEFAGDYCLGRLAVVKSHRKKSLGKLIIGEAESYVRALGGKRILLHAQCRVTAFYEKVGYTMFGEVEDDQGCPHIWMEKVL